MTLTRFIDILDANKEAVAGLLMALLYLAVQCCTLWIWLGPKWFSEIKFLSAQPVEIP